MYSALNRTLVRPAALVQRRQMHLISNQVRMFAVQRRYSKTHEWLDYDTDTNKGKLGISKYAANALGDIVHVDLPEEGDSFT